MASPAPPPPPPPPPSYQQADPHAPPSRSQHDSRHDPKPHHRPSSQSKHHHDKSKSKPHDKPGASKPKPPPPAPAPAPAQTADQALRLRLRRETPFLATIRFRNDLPEVPGDPKLLVSQQPPEKLAAFALTNLEKESKHELILPQDLGITLGVLDMERYAVPKDKPALHPDDLKLLGAEADSLLLSSPLAGVSKAGLGQGSPSAAIRRGTALRQAAEVSWLMRTTYLAADGDGPKPIKGQTEYDARREKMRAPASEEAEEDEEAQRLAQVRTIESTFVAARQPPVHPSKPGMRAMEIMEVLPDLDWWSHKFMSAHFDKDPAEELEELSALNNQDVAKQVVGLGVLKGFKLEDDVAETKAGAPSNEGRFMALLLPRDVSKAAQVLRDEGESGVPADMLEGERSWAREYSYELTNKNNKKAETDRAGNTQQAYILRFQGGKALYCELNSTLELRGKREGGRKTTSQFQRPSKVVLRKRAATAREQEESKRRRHALRSTADDADMVDDSEAGAEEAGAAAED